MPWILANGLHSQTSAVRDPGYVEIGNPDLIEKRRRRPVPVPPGGTLSDYVPFYFAPYAPMLSHIKTGRNGILRRPIFEIVILVSSLPTFAAAGIPFVFTDQHASLLTASFFATLADLPRLDWALWQTHEVEREPRDRTSLRAARPRPLRPACAGHRAARRRLLRGGRAADVEETMRNVPAPLDVVRRPDWFL